MDKTKKTQVTQEIKDMLNDSKALYFADFTGLTVAEANELRDEFYKSNLKYRVVKNTLLKRALSDSENYSESVEEFSQYLVGPTGVVFATDDPVSPAKILKKYFDKSEKPKLKIAFVDNQIFESDKLNMLASMLTREELIAGICGSLNSPVSGIVGSINAVMRDLFSVIEEVARKNSN